MGNTNIRKENRGKTLTEKKKNLDKKNGRMKKNKVVISNSRVLFKTKFVETHLNNAQAFILTLIMVSLEVLKLVSPFISLFLLGD